MKETEIKLINCEIIINALIILIFNARKQYKVTDYSLNILFPIGHFMGVIPVGGQINHQLFFLVGVF